MDHTPAERIDQAEIELLKRMHEEMYLARLLNGEYGSEKEALQTPERCRFRLDSNHFMVMSISVDDFSSAWLDISMDSFESLRNTLIPRIRDEFFGFLAGIFENYYCILDRTMMIIICLQEEAFTAEVASSIGVIRKRTMECVARLKSQGIIASVMLSEVCNGAMGIRDGYQQIKQLREYKRIMRIHDDFMIYGYVDQPKNTVSVDRRVFETTKDFIDALQKQNYGKAQHQLAVLTEKLFDTRSVIPKNIETVYHYYIHILFLAVEEIKKHTPGQVNDLMMPEKLFFPAYSVPEILEKMEHVLKLLDDMRQQGGLDGPNPAWYNAVLQYIEIHFTEVSLNVSGIADHFSMSPAFLSNSFKGIAGIRMLDYINMLRVQYAKKRILAGDTVTNAAERAGFGSVLTMRRAFVKFEGTLPSKL